MTSPPSPVLPAIAAVIVVGVLGTASCATRSAKDSAPPEVTLSVSVQWPQRAGPTIATTPSSGAIQALSSALSGCLTLAGAASDGTDVALAFDRDAAVEPHLEVYRSAGPARPGTWPLALKLHAEFGCAGAIVGTAQANVELNGEGSIKGEVVVSPVVASVEVRLGQRFRVGETRSLACVARDSSGAVVPVSQGSFTFEIQGGAGTLQLAGGQMVGVAEGTATVIAAADGRVSVPVTIPVYGPITQQYDVADLGSLGGTRVTPRAVNSYGQVTGSATLADGSVRGFYGAGGALTDIGVFPGYLYSEAYGINDAGQVVGTCSPGRIYPGATLGIGALGPAGSKYQVQHAIVWQAGVLSYLAPPGYADCRTPLAVNGAGVAVGTSLSVWHPGIDLIQGAMVWEGGVATSLFELDGLGAAALAIDSEGHIVGWSHTSGGNHAAFWFGGEVRDLNALTTNGADWVLQSAAGINDAQQIIGWASGGAGSGGFIWESGSVEALGTFPDGTWTNPKGINSAAWVVGQAGRAAGNRAFVWHGGWLADLNDLIPPGSGWTLMDATAIGNGGHIVGTGLLAGQDRAFILTPR